MFRVRRKLQKRIKEERDVVDRDLLAQRRNPISCSEKPGRSSISVSALSHISHSVNLNH
jgi:hypothetical protein